MVNSTTSTKEVMGALAAVVKKAAMPSAALTVLLPTPPLPESTVHALSLIHIYRVPIPQNAPKTLKNAQKAPAASQGLRLSNNPFG